MPDGAIMGTDGRPRRALAVMARAPEPGQVKTRLVPPLSARAAANLYTAMIDARLAGAQILDATLVVAFTPPEAEGWFAARLPRAGQALPQIGGSLAERLRAVFQALFAQGCHQVVAVDSDSPTLPVDYLRDAFRLLDDPAVDLVLGPTLDGGYYAIGMRADHPAAFDVPMSTPDVLADTLRRARQAGLRAALLPEWYDVDTPADLDRLASDVAAGVGEPAPDVRAWLDKLDEA